MRKFLISFFFTIVSTTYLIAAPKAVVFDFGGVMTGEPNRQIVVNFIRKSFHLSHAEFDKLNQKKREAVKHGQSDEEFWTNYAKNQGIALPSNWTESYRAVMKEALGINMEMYALVEELRDQEIVVALLSNIDERLSKLIRDFGLYKPFNPCILSHEIGIEKPDPEIYKFLLAKLNLPSHEVIFIDDRVENIEAAKQLGIDAILFESESQLRSALVERISY